MAPIEALVQRSRRHRSSRAGRLGPARLPWRDIVRWAGAGTLVMVILVLFDLSRHGGGNPVSLIQPGTRGPARAAVEEDFPGIEVPEGLGLDGQQYYAIARNPFRPREVADDLHRPRYRLQRPMLPWLGWALHPAGGGTGLIWAMFAVGVGALLLGGVATGALSAILRGPPFLAALFPLLPGAYWSLRVTVSDAMAVGLALAAVALAARKRHGTAVLVGVVAVLAKEPALLVLGGWAVWRRTRRDTLVATIPLAALLLWMAVLRVVVPGSEATTSDLTVPFSGVISAWREIWSSGEELVGMVSSLGAVAAGAVAILKRGLRHPLGWAIVPHLVFFSVMGMNPVAMNFGGTRTGFALALLAALSLATPKAGRAKGHEVLQREEPGFASAATVAHAT